LYAMGEMVASRTHLEQALALYDPGQRHAFIARAGGDLGRGSLALLANVLWWLGYPDQARQRNRAALSLAQDIDPPWSTVVVWRMTVVLHQSRHEPQAVQQQAEAQVALAQEQGFAALLAGATVRRGWALAAQGQAEEGISQMRQGLAASRATGTELWRTYNL